MNKRLKISLIISATVVGLAIVLLVLIKYDIIFVNCDKMKKQTETMLNKANYCEKDSDCTALTGPDCLIDCYKFINKKVNPDATRKKVEKYSQRCGERCLYKCATIPKAEDIACENKKCGFRYEDTLIY